MGSNKDKVEYEITTADKQLSQRGPNQLKVFVYPFGRVSQAALEILNQQRYQLAFTTKRGFYQCPDKRLTLPRIRVGNAPLSVYGL